MLTFFCMVIYSLHLIWEEMEVVSVYAYFFKDLSLGMLITIVLIRKRVYHFKIFKGRLPQISLGPFLNTLSQPVHGNVQTTSNLVFYLCIVKVEKITWNHSFQQSDRIVCLNDLKNLYSSADKNKWSLLNFKKTFLKVNNYYSNTNVHILVQLV